jgi:hypothetical protein
VILALEVARRLPCTAKSQSNAVDPAENLLYKLGSFYYLHADVDE